MQILQIQVPAGVATTRDRQGLAAYSCSRVIIAGKGHGGRRYGVVNKADQGVTSEALPYPHPTPRQT